MTPFLVRRRTAFSETLRPSAGLLWLIPFGIELGDAIERSGDFRFAGRRNFTRVVFQPGVACEQQWLGFVEPCEIQHDFTEEATSNTGLPRFASRLASTF